MLRSIERVTGTNFADTFDATGFGSTSLNAGSIGVGGLSDGTFNEFEGLGGNDQITGNNNTRVSYLQAAAGVTVTFTALGVGSAHGTDPGDVAGMGPTPSSAVLTASVARTSMTASPAATIRPVRTSCSKAAAAMISSMAAAVLTPLSMATKTP